MKKLLMTLAGISCMAMATASQAAVVTFTGGTYTQNDAVTGTTGDSFDHDNIDFYTESGFKLDFVGNSGPFDTHVGD